MVLLDYKVIAYQYEVSMILSTILISHLFWSSIPPALLWIGNYDFGTYNDLIKLSSMSPRICMFFLFKSTLSHHAPFFQPDMPKLYSQLTVYICLICLSVYHIWIKSSGTCHYASSLFYSTWYLPILSKWPWVAWFYLL